MSRRLRLSALPLATLLLIGITAPGQAQPRTMGSRLNTPDATGGYTLFGPRLYPQTYLIDNEGRLVHSWLHTYPARNMNYLLENGHLLRCAQAANAVFIHGGAGGRLQEWDWEGNLLWEFLYSNDEVCGHHDIEPLPNGNVLVVAWEYKTAAEAIAAGRDPAFLREALWPGHIAEVEPVGSDDANIVWEWHAWDHLIQDFDSTKPNFGVIAEHPELIDLNKGRDDREDWLHINAVDYNEQLDQIVISSNFFNELWIIDHSTTSEEAAGHTGGIRGMGGDLLYRWGNPAMYDRGTIDDQVFFGGNHDVHWIDPGLPGEGHLLIFNNGSNRPDGSYSSVEELVTTVDVNGDYPVPPPGEPHGPAAALWTYTSDPPEEFYSNFFSGQQRQANGNTLICEGASGRIFEIDPSEEIVWEYVVPVNAGGPMYQGTVPSGNATFRAPRYGLQYPGLIGHDLMSGEPIELYGGTSVATGRLESSRFSLEQNYPNPFRPATTIAFSLRDPGPVKLEIFNVAGRRVVTVLDEYLDIGRHRYTWRAPGLPSGVYHYRLRVGAETATRSMILVR